MIDMNFFEPLPPKRPFNFAAYLLPQGVADLLWDDPNIRAAWRAGVLAGQEMRRDLTDEQEAREGANAAVPPEALRP